MAQSYGFIEISGVTAAVYALDIMCKTAEVKFEGWQRRLGGRLVTVIVSGKVSAVREAVDAAINQGIKKPAATGVIASPHSEIVRLVEQNKG